MHKKQFVFYIASVILLLVAYQNCADGKFRARQKAQLSGVTATPGVDGSFDSSCMTNLKYNACVFYKNPVASSGRVLSGPLNLNTDLSLHQVFAVNITDDQLENTDFSIVPSSGSRTGKSSNGDWKFQFQNNSERQVQQVNSYFWANQLSQWLKKNAGQSFFENQKVKIDTYAPNKLGIEIDFASKTVRIGSGFAPHLDASPVEIAVNSDLLIESLGQMNVYLASNDIINFSTSSHNACSVNGACYCKTKLGCAKAVLQGFGILQRSFIFSNSLESSESIVNKVSGTKYCGMSTDISQLLSLTADQANTACASGFGLPNGETMALGYLFASAVWEVIYDKDHLNPDGLKLVIELMKQVRGNDTFTTVLQKIESIDSSLFGGKMSASFRDAFSRRGMN